MVDQCRAADGAGRIAQRAAADHEMEWIAAVWLAYDNFLAAELFAAHGAHRRRFIVGQFHGAVGSVGDVLRPQLVDRHIRPIMQQALGGRI